jgi:hypothetical protein
MLLLELNADTDKTIHLLRHMVGRQLPRAMAKALTGLAFDGRDAVRNDLPGRFTLRRPWVAKGIRTESATASRLTARVYSRDYFMELQETGGVKTGKLSIPVGRMAAIARSKVIPKSLWPRALCRQKNVFVRGGTLFERDGRDISPLYLLRSRQKVSPRFGMRQTVFETVRNRACVFRSKLTTARVLSVRFALRL